MHIRIGCLGFVMVLAGASAAQELPKVPNPGDMYCSGAVTNESVPRDTYVISGEQANYKVTFEQGDLVYVNKGSDQGVKVGDEFLVVRSESDPLKFKWFSWQPSLLRAMGTLYKDVGRVRVLNVLPKVATAEIVFSCDYMQRGDIALAFAERPAPPFRQDVKFDRFAPPSGKKTAMVVIAKDFAQGAGTNAVIYVNLGGAQDVKVGDYFRIFRYQGGGGESVYQTRGIAYQVYGFGSTPQRYTWEDLPREILGEGIVLRALPNSSTVLITFSRREIFLGDYVELE